MISGVLRDNRAARVTHTIVHLEGSVRAEFHVHLSGNSETPAGEKSLGVSFQLPDTLLEISAVTVNGQNVLEHTGEDLEKLYYISAPGDTKTLANIFARLAANRRDLISYEEMRKAHRAASAHSSWSLLVNVPETCTEETLTISVQITTSTSSGLSLGELWFPLCSGLVSLPSGAPATRQSMDQQKHRVSVYHHGGDVVVSGDRQEKKSFVLFESSWLNPRFCGHYALPSTYVSFTHADTFTAYVAAPLRARAHACLSGVVGEIMQVLAPWFASPAQQLPLIHIVLFPLPQAYLVEGNVLILDEDAFLYEPGLPEKQVAATSLLAEAIASLWISRTFPAFSDPWIPVGLAALLSERFVGFHFGANEAAYRLEAKRVKLHNMVERGLDWRPLCIIGEESDPLMRIKAGLVMESLLLAVVGEADMRNALHELGAKSSNKSIDTDAFWHLLVSTVGSHTEAGRALIPFRQEWVRGVGVPLIHVGFTLVDKKRFLLQATQRPLQRVNIHDNVPLASSSRVRGGCACSQDFVARTDEGGQTSYMRQHATWTGRRRFWPGELEVAIFRSSVARVTAAISMAADDPVHSTLLTVPFVSPRKHELVLTRTARDDELVHGWLAVTDPRWLLAKIVLCQSALMWANQLQWSRSVPQELAAVEALQHVRGSALICELLRDVLAGSAFNYRVRQDAGKALIHLAIGCGEREAGEFVIRWLISTQFSNCNVQDFLTLASVSEQLAYAKRSMDRRDHAAIAAALLTIVRDIELSLTTGKQAVVSADHALAKALKLAIVARETPSEAVQVATVWLRSDLYGPPLASRDLVVTEALLSTNVLPELADKAFLDSLVQLPHNRRLNRTALRAYLDAGQSTEDTWRFRFSWIEKLTLDTHPRALSWLVDAWEYVLERMRRDHHKSPLHVLIQHKDTCDRLWRYLTCSVPLLPHIARAYVEACVHAIYIQAYGTGVPAPYRSESKICSGGPLSFWLPFAEHERIYKKFMLRGATVKAEPPPMPTKKPRLLITSQGSVAFAS